MTAQQLEALKAKAAIKTQLKTELKQIQMAWSKTLSRFYDSRDPLTRNQLSKEIKALEVKITELKKKVA